MSYQKRMPADWIKTIEEGLTFLNDKKIDGELYAYLMSQSYGKNGQTVVEKKKLPTQSEICQIIGIKSRTTYNTHMKYLIAKEYVKEENGFYILFNPESMYFEIPQDTLEYFNNVAHEQVIKAFICLGQMWKYGQSKNKKYVFSKKELGTRIGINMEAGGGKAGYKVVNDILTSLTRQGFIKCEEFYDNNITPRYRLTYFTVEYPKDFSF